MKTSDKMIIAMIAMLLGLVMVMSTSCSTTTHCPGISAKPVANKYVAQKTSFNKKHYNY